jgi:Fe-S cluster assembly iron-binding protein IscA
MKNQYKVIKKYLPKDLIQLIVANSNKKGTEYNWEFINKCNDNDYEINKFSTTDKHKVNIWDNIDSLKLSFIEDTNVESIVYISKDKFETFIQYISFNHLIEFEKYSFKVVFDFNDTMLLKEITVIATRETEDTIYDNNKFVF